MVCVAHYMFYLNENYMEYIARYPFANQWAGILLISPHCIMLQMRHMCRPQIFGLKCLWGIAGVWWNDWVNTDVARCLVMGNCDESIRGTANLRLLMCLGHVLSLIVLFLNQLFSILKVLITQLTSKQFFFEI